MQDDYDGPILEIDNLSISFFTRLREIPAVMDFSVRVRPGEAVGLGNGVRQRGLLDGGVPDRSGTWARSRSSALLMTCVA